MNDQGRPSDLEYTELLSAMDEVIGTWQRWVSAGTINLRPRPEFAKTGQQAAMIVTLTQHLFQLAKVIRPHLPENLPITLVPVAREALETGVWIVWADRFEDSAASAINEAERNRKNLRHTMAASDLIPDDLISELPEWTELPTSTKEHARNLQKMTAALEMPEIYAYYRIFSEHSHPGVRVSDQYIFLDDGGRPVFRETAPPGFESVLATRLLPLFMVKAARIITFMTRDNDQRREIRAIGRSLRVNVDELFGPRNR